LDVLDVRKQREHITLYHHRKYEGVRSVFEPCKEARGKGRLAKGYMYFYHALCRKRKHESKDNTNGKITLQIKIPKEDIAEVFNYTRKELEKIKTLTAIEEVIAINEFYEFNYDYVYKNVLTPQMKQAILEDYYTNQGMKARMDESASEQLF